jgi:hypothetical protein
MAPTRTSYLFQMPDLYGVADADERRRLADLARQGQRKHYWSEFDELIPEGTAHYFALEAAATRIRTYALQYVPELISAPACAGFAGVASRPDLRQQSAPGLAALAAARRERLGADPGRLHVLIDETALRRPAHMFREQCRHLTEEIIAGAYGRPGHPRQR